MTAAWRFAAALLLALLFSGMAMRNAGVICIAIPFLAVVLVPALRALPRASAAACSSVSRGSSEEGKRVKFRVTVSNRGPTVDHALLRVVPPEKANLVGQANLVTFLEAGAERIFELELAGPRGRHIVSTVMMETQDALGLQSRVERLQLDLEVCFLPRTEIIRTLDIFPRRPGPGSGTVRSKLSGSGSEFFGTREYSSGDPLRRLNWRAAERWNRLVTNLYEEERTADVGIILDARQASDVVAHGASLFESSVRMAASVAEYFLARGNRVGLLSYGRALEWVFPGYGQVQRRRILSLLSAAMPGDHVVFREFEALPTRLFPPKSQLVVVSPLLPGDVPTLRYLRALGFELLVISPDPLSLEAGAAPINEEGDLAWRVLKARREATLTMLRRAGARVVDWDVVVPPAPALSRLGRGGSA